MPLFFATNKRILASKKKPDDGAAKNFKMDLPFVYGI